LIIDPGIPGVKQSTKLLDKLNWTLLYTMTDENIIRINTYTPCGWIIRRQLETIYREESRRIFATLLRLLGDFNAAEDALKEAFKVTAQQWPTEGLPKI